MANEAEVLILGNQWKHKEKQKLQFGLKQSE